MYVSSANSVSGSTIQMRMTPRAIARKRAGRIADACDATVVNATGRAAPCQVADHGYAPGMIVHHTRAPIATRVLSAAQAFSQGNRFFSGQLLNASA